MTSPSTQDAAHIETMEVSVTSISMIENLIRNFEPNCALVKDFQSLLANEYFKLLNPAGVENMCKYVNSLLRSGFSAEEISEILFHPQIPTEEDIERYRTGHNAMYRDAAQTIANELLNGLDIAIIESGMYGGKSTKAYFVCKSLKKKSYGVVVVGPDFMGGHVTIRGAIPEGQSSSSKGFKQLDANKYSGRQSLYKIFKDIKPDAKIVIHIDEYSFLSDEDVCEIITYIQANFRNAKILLVGLDSNYLGQMLNGYYAGTTFSHKKFECKSFVKGDDDKPKGTHTKRYIKLGEMLVLDTGFANVVIPKECPNVLYCPEMRCRHISTYLDPKELFPTDNKSLLMRQALTNRIYNPNSLTVEL